MNDSSHQVVLERLRKLRNERESTFNLIQKQQLELKALDAKIEELDTLLPLLPPSPSSNGADNAHGGNKSVELLPADAVIGFIRNSPGSIRSTIIDALEGKVSTNAADQRRLLFTTIWRLKKRGIIRDDDGHLFPADKAAN